MDFSSPKDPNVEKQPSYANKNHNSQTKEDIVIEDSKVTKDILIVQDSTIEFIQDSRVEDVSAEEQSLPVSSWEKMTHKLLLRRFQMSLQIPRIR